MCVAVAVFRLRVIVCGVVLVVCVLCFCLMVLGLC